MKDNKLNQNYSKIQPSLSPSNNNNHRLQLNSFRSRYLCQKPSISSCQTKLKNTYSGHFGPIAHHNYGIFSMEKISLERIKEQHQLLENAKLPSFNIKKFFDKTSKKSKDIIDSEDSPKNKGSANKKYKFDRQDLQSFWSRYIQTEQLIKSPINQLSAMNKEIGLVINRSKNKSEALNRTVQNSLKQQNIILQELYDNNKSQDRTTFFVNNFIKTRYRKRNKSKSKEAKTQEVPKLQLQIKPHKIKEEIPQGNWVVPWEKHQDTEEDATLNDF